MFYILILKHEDGLPPDPKRHVGRLKFPRLDHNPHFLAVGVRQS